jgi:6-phosphogluconate dehydrogenase
MQLGMIGLGRMGGNMVRRLLRNGHECVVYGTSDSKVQPMVEAGAIGTTAISDFVGKLKTPRAVWLMVPAAVVDSLVEELSPLLGKGDILIDGGNSYYIDDIRRAKALAPRGIHYLDVGTSGGVWGLERGYCLMVGGPDDAVRHIEPILRTLAPGQGPVEPTPSLDLSKTTAHEGFIHCGPPGAGHFVKMIHNGIEYGLMQAYAEGFDILRHADSETLPEEQRFALNLPEIAEVWRRGSVISSWLLDLAARALVADPQLAAFEGFVPDSGEGRWTVDAAIDEEVPADVLTTALYTRFRSRRDHTFAEKLLSALRAQFGGHVEHPR